MGWACSTNEGEEKRILVGKPEGRRPLGRSLEDRSWRGGVDWSGSG
jgi:hypothetical protein